jgi:hypothetical protein
MPPLSWLPSRPIGQEGWDCASFPPTLPSHACLPPSPVHKTYATERREYDHEVQELERLEQELASLPVPPPPAVAVAALEATRAAACLSSLLV